MSDLHTVYTHHLCFCLCPIRMTYLTCIKTIHVFAIRMKHLTCIKKIPVCFCYTFITNICEHLLNICEHLQIYTCKWHTLHTYTYTCIHTPRLCWIHVLPGLWIVPNRWRTPYRKGRSVWRAVLPHLCVCVCVYVCMHVCVYVWRVAVCEELPCLICVCVSVCIYYVCVFLFLCVKER